MMTAFFSRLFTNDSQRQAALGATDNRQRFTGEIVRVVDDRGFGFIRCDRLNSDVFLHASALAGWPLQVGLRITFALGEDSRGRRRAEDARVVASAGDAA